MQNNLLNVQLQIIPNAWADTSKDLLLKFLGPGFEEVGLIIKDQFGFWRWRNSLRLLNKVKKISEMNGIELKNVPIKILLPLLENNSLEEDKTMQDRWAALLINAANPKFEETVRPSFIEILKQLSPKEAAVLDSVFEMIESQMIPKDQWTFKGAIGSGIRSKHELAPMDFEIAIDNLYRLRLCQPPSTNLEFIEKKEQRFQLQMKDIVCLTQLGYVFVKSCKICNVVNSENQ